MEAVIIILFAMPVCYLPVSYAYLALWHRKWTFNTLSPCRSCIRACNGFNLHYHNCTWPLLTGFMALFQLKLIELGV